MGSAQQPRSILMVDDVELFLELEQTFFHRDGFDLLMAVNAREIMQLVLQHRPKLVFLDLQISGARGEDLCRWIKNDPALKDTPVIMLVPAGNLAAEALCRQAGCDAIIHTPVKRKQLLSVARQTLGLTDRGEDRQPARLLVNFGPGADRRHSNFSVNLSTGGLFVATHEVLPVDTPLSLQIKFPDRTQQLETAARVAWRNHPELRKQPHLPTGMGIEFSPLAASQRLLVQDFLQRQTA